MKSLIRSLTSLVCFLLTGSHALCEAPLFDHLTAVGVHLGDGNVVPLAEPQFNAGLDSVDRQNVVGNIAGAAGWTRFSRKSALAPIEIDLQYVKDADGERIGHEVYVAFVIHAGLETIRDRDLMKRLFIVANEEKRHSTVETEAASDQELAKWGIDARDPGTTYTRLQFPLLERVLVRGYVKAQRNTNSEVGTIAWLLDPRFNLGVESGAGNTWTPIERDGDDHEVGEAHRYQGAGGYVRVNPLPEIESACLVEIRFVFHEPKEWFRGSNQLRSKLPLMIQESVRKLRRTLEKAEQS